MDQTQVGDNLVNGGVGGAIPDRSNFTLWDTIRYIWTQLNLPEQALDSLVLEGSGHGFQSSFRIGHLAQSTVALSALTAALVHSLRTRSTIPRVTVTFRHSCLEFIIERLYTIDGRQPILKPGLVGGLQRVADGYVRIHDNFPNHRDGTLKLLGLNEKPSKEEVFRALQRWKKLELEEIAAQNKLAIYALRSYEEWDASPQAQAVSNFPVVICKISDDGPEGLPASMKQDADRCLRGLRVLELSRVIAAPVAGKTLASHGADVLWVTSPKLPDLPDLDRNLSRGKRTIQLDLNEAGDAATMRGLVKDCDVWIQGYRPRSLAAKGFGAADLISLKPGLIYANLSAFGPSGPWSERRGFDSLVQTCSGMNVSEAAHFGEGEAARPMPCQALDYAGGYFLATGVAAALYRRAVEGGSWEVHVSLAGVMKYLRSLGQLPGRGGFEATDPAPKLEEVPNEYFEERESGFGILRATKHAPGIGKATPGFDHMPKELGSDKPRWLQPVNI